MIEGKIANQCPRIKLSGKVNCSKCQKQINAPFGRHVILSKKTYYLASYLETSHFIYESKSGTASAYCSKYCAVKHNHRFNKC